MSGKFSSTNRDLESLQGIKWGRIGDTAALFFLFFTRRPSLSLSPLSQASLKKTPAQRQREKKELSPFPEIFPTLGGNFPKKENGECPIRVVSAKKPHMPINQPVYSLSEVLLPSTPSQRDLQRGSNDEPYTHKEYTYIVFNRDFLAKY